VNSLSGVIRFGDNVEFTPTHTLATFKGSRVTGLTTGMEVKEEEWNAQRQWAWLLPVSVTELEGVGARRAAVLGEFGVQTVGQLLLRLPRRYIDRSRVVPIRDAPLGEEVTLIVSVLDSPGQQPGGRRRSFRRRPPIRARLGDGTGELECVWFHGHHPHLNQGDTIAVSGKIERYEARRLQIAHPEIEPVGDGAIHTGAIVPVYGSGEDLKATGLTNRRWRSLVRAALNRFVSDIAEPLPDVGEGLGLPGIQASLQAVHAPASMEEAELGRRRLALEELLGLQTALARRRQARLQCRGIQHTARVSVAQFVGSLPFSLTRAQQGVIEEILDDMAAPSPMCRLLHGEVGSGKTVVALCAVLAALESGCQVALMAPTEVLAEQHFATISRHAAFAQVSNALLLGGRSSSDRRELLAAVSSGSVRLVVGTHALLQDDVRFQRLGLIIVDEQHRFGVAQREVLSQKGDHADVLVMTATPIPRSLAMTLYGDLEVSTLDEVPSGRRPVRTALRRSHQRPQVLEFVAQELAQGRQAYLVYPMIDEEDGAGTLSSATSAFNDLSKGPLAGFDLRLLHGRMSSAEKSAVMSAFSRGGCQALVCTTVVEVGLDVPCATLMVVENADRFGLAQLHQLRGRVGRSGEAQVQAYCILIADPDDDDIAMQRLQVLCQTADGFTIAQKDLELRGPGELHGTRQAGMPGLLIAGPADEDLLLAAREQAIHMVENAGREESLYE